ncbi:hypothetical protein Vadar_033168 [Vaccinium darrowii]|uniref:Uncharacterized protein n=1 Tax=Vaccinium darrowii TaxID=229202 RepID=A0ACB7XM17_9ERIC|nr:hypothetical protein Vadar_033168 [Vaccinium darrowii]
MENGITLAQLRARRLYMSLAKEADVKNQRLCEIESKYEDTAACLGRKIAENDRLQQAFDNEMKRMELIEQENKRLKWELECQTRNMRSLKLQNENMKHDLVFQRKELLQRAKNLKQDKSEDYLELEHMPAENGLTDESMVKVNEADEIEYEENLDKSLIYEMRLCEMERKYDETCAILVRKIAENDRLHQAVAEDMRTVDLIERQNKKLKYELDCTKLQNEKLKRGSGYERRELVKRVKELEKQKSQVDLGPKNILAEKEELNNRTTAESDDHHALREAFKEKVEEIQYLEDLIKTLTLKERMSNDELQDARKEAISEIINEDDEKLKVLRNERGDDVYKAVANALLEMNNYNSSGMYAVPEIWNAKEERKASLKEIVSYLIKQWKTNKQTNKRKRKVISI